MYRIGSVVGWLLASPGAWGAEPSPEGGARRGPAAERVVRDDADLVLLVTGERAGRPGPCGCANRPLGGLEAQEAYVQALEAAGQPLLVLDVGGWLDATAEGTRLTAEAEAANHDYLRALRRARVDVLNVGWTELAALHGRARPGLVSANLTGAVGVLDHVVREVGGLRVLVTGVSREGRPFLWPEEARFAPPVEAVRGVVQRVQADVVVVLVHDDPKVALALAELPGVDVVVDGAGYAERWPVDTGAAVRARTWAEGTRLTELRLHVAEGSIEAVIAREIDLDEGIGAARRW